VLLAACLALSCIACAQEPPSLAQSGREAVVFWRLSAYKGTGLQRPTQQVVTDEQEFRVLWEQIFTNSPPQALPAVNFSREAVIVVGLGGRSDGAERLQIDAILDDGSGLEVLSTTTIAGKGCAVTLSLTAPVEVVRIAATRRPITFTMRTRTRDCT